MAAALVSVGADAPLCAVARLLPPGGELEVRLPGPGAPVRLWCRAGRFPGTVVFQLVAHPVSVDGVPEGGLG